MEPVIKMSESNTKPLVPTTIADEVVSVTGRRRPGRLEDVNPNLLPLLRKAERERLPVLVEDPPVALMSEIDPATQALPPFVRYESPTEWFGEGEGTALGVILGSLLWVGIIGSGWALFRNFF